MTPRKKLTLKIAAGLLVFLVACTILSQTIYRLLLPIVETVQVTQGSLGTWVEADGTPGFQNETEILAGDNWRVTDVLVKKGAVVTAGTPLFKVDVSQANIALEQSELALLRLKNQLNANSVTGAERAELELQIQIAEGELAAYREGLPLSNDIEELRLKLAVIQLENQTEIDQEALRIARENLSSYQRKGAGMDTAELLKLDMEFASLQKRLQSNRLSDERREELEAELAQAQEERDELSYGYDGYDPLYEQQLKQAVLQAEQNLKANPSERDRSVYQLQMEIAQEELALYQQKQKSSSELNAKKLELTVLQLKNQLAGSAKTEAERQELAIQIRIAEEELALQRASWPADGIVTAPAGGTITALAARKGETLLKGVTAVSLATEESQPCLRWSLSREAGNDYQGIQAVTVTLPQRGNIYGQAETITAAVSDRVLDEQTDRWIYTAGLEKGVAEPGQTLRVRMVKSGASYDQIVPLSCLRKDEYGNDTVLVVKTRQGMFSVEDYIAELRVEVLEENSLNAAVSCSEFEYNTRLVHYSSKPVSPGSVVSVGRVEQ